MKTSIKNTILLLALLSSISSFAQYSGGTGSADDPFQLATKYDLGYLSTDTLHWGSEELKYHFVLTNDIVFEAADFEPGGDFFNEGRGFTPIGGYLPYRFIGVFDGRSHAIINLKIHTNATLIGLFTRVSKSEIRSLSVTNVDISGTGAVGGLCGTSFKSTISNVFVSGNISLFDDKDQRHSKFLQQSNDDVCTAAIGMFGGLVGAITSGSISRCYVNVNVLADSLIGGLIGTVNTLEPKLNPEGESESAFIVMCAAYGNVNGQGEAIGGLIGGLYNNGEVRQCYAYGEVNGGEMGSGQLVGMQCASAIYDSYATGSVTGEDLVASISSYAYKSSICNSYATGSIEGVSRVNGVATSYQGNIYNSYYDYETSGFGNESTSGALATAQFATEEPFLEWDFDTIWCFGKDRDNHIRPILQWMADTITYHLDGGIDTTQNPNYYTGNGDVILEHPYREDYTFMGWYDNVELAGEPQTTIVSGTHGNLELWAKWQYNNSVASEEKLKLQLYPNPAQSAVHITCDRVISTVQLFSLSGVMLETVHPNSKEVSMILSDIATGVYVVRIVTDEKQQVVKLVVE